MVFKLRYITTMRIPHVYCQLFSATAENHTYALLGNLKFNKVEFEVFRELVEDAGVKFEEDLGT